MARLAKSSAETVSVDSCAPGEPSRERVTGSAIVMGRSMRLESAQCVPVKAIATSRVYACSNDDVVCKVSGRWAEMKSVTIPTMIVMERLMKGLSYSSATVARGFVRPQEVGLPRWRIDRHVRAAPGCPARNL